MSLSVRPAAATDIRAIAAIYAHAVRHGTASFELEPPSETEMARRYQAIVDGGHPYLVAEIAGTVAGYAYAGPFRPRLAYRFSVEDSIYIAPDSHRRGVGKALLAALLAESQTRGYRQMIAVIGDSANAPSIELHRAAGFAMVGILAATGFKFGRWIDTVLMQRPLGPGAETLPPGGESR